MIDIDNNNPHTCEKGVTPKNRARKLAIIVHSKQNSTCYVLFLVTLLYSQKSNTIFLKQRALW